MPDTHVKPDSILSVKDFSIHFLRYGRGFQRRKLCVICNLEVEIKAGEIVAVVGSSGSGKSLLAHAILGILPPNAIVTGDAYYRGERLTARRQAELRGTGIALVPQSVNFLDPLMTVGKQVKGERKSKDEVEAVFKRYGLAPGVMDRETLASSSRAAIYGRRNAASPCRCGN
jgi:peptide/nickel transport system ATP-binding protein